MFKDNRIFSSQILLLLLCIFPPKAQALLVLNDQSNYSTKDIADMNDGDEVYAVVNLAEKGYKIIKTKVTATKTENAEWGQLISFSSKENAEFYIKGIDLENGPIDAAKLYNFSLKFGETKKLPLKIKGKISISGEKIFDNKEKPKEFSIKNYTITIDVNGAKASIVDSETSRIGLGILFLGDINRDGYPDLFVTHNRLDKEGRNIFYMSEYKNKKYNLNNVYEH